MPSILLDTGILLVTVRYVKALKEGGPLFYYRRIPDTLRPHYGGKRFRRISLGTRDISVAAPKATKLAAEDDALWASMRSDQGQRERLTTPQVREAAGALIASLGLSTGALLKRDPLFHGPDAGEVFDDYLEKRHGTAYADIRHNQRMPPAAHEAFWSPVEHEAVRILKEDPTRPRALLSEALAVYLKDHDKGGHPKFAGDAKRAIGHVFSLVGDFHRKDPSHAWRHRFKTLARTAGMSPAALTAEAKTHPWDW